MVKRSIRTVYSWLSRRRKIQLAGVFAMSLLGAVAELASIGAVLPFITLLANPKAADALPFGKVLAPLLATAPGSDFGPVARLTLLFGGLVLAAAAIRLTLTWVSTRFTQGVGHDLALRVYSRTLYQPYRYHVSRNTSELIAGIGKVQGVVNGVLTPALETLIAAVLGLAILAALFSVNWKLTLAVALSFGALYGVLSRISRTRLVRNSRIAARAATDRTRILQESYGGIRDAILDGSQAMHISQFATADNAEKQAVVEKTLWAQIPKNVVEALGISIIATLAVLAASKAGGVTQALPLLATLALGAQKLLPLFQRLYNGWHSVTASIGALEDVERMASLRVASESIRKGNANDLPFKRRLSLQNIGFRYNEDSPWVFRGITLDIHKGARIGFAGQTGCGKTTLLDVVLGLLQPVEGELIVDDVAISTQNVRDWQARIAHVPQHIFLADTSIAENIAFDEQRDTIDMHRVEMAAERACIHEFVATLPEGYHTVVGERGVRLSGGQRQRLGIARALYRNADVLVMDEATSALDEATEKNVLRNLSESAGDVTMLVVAHRQQTLDQCETVVHLDAHGTTVRRNQGPMSMTKNLDRVAI